MYADDGYISFVQSWSQYDDFNIRNNVEKVNN